MCLTLKKRAVEKIAKKDIKCVKVIMLRKGHWMTPYQLKCISPGQHFTSNIVVEGYVTGNRTIDIGIHSFVPGSGKIDMEIGWFSDNINYAKAIDCIIPKGAKYWLGDFEGFENCSYVSNELIYPKEF